MGMTIISIMFHINLVAFGLKEIGKIRKSVVAENHNIEQQVREATIATTQPTTQNNLKQLLLGWSYNW
jgi:hypothetical protein